MIIKHVKAPLYIIIIIITRRRTRSLPGHLDGDHVAWPGAMASTQVHKTATSHVDVVAKTNRPLCGFRQTPDHLISLAATALLHQ